jgi:hypothetical protein
MKTNTGRDQSIEDRLEAEYAEAWRPKAGATLVGEVVDITRLTSTYDGAAYPCVTIKSDGEELAFHAFHAVAKRELTKIRPLVGDTIGIKYIGLKETQDGRNVHVYRVASNASGAEFSWGDFTGEGMEPSAAENINEGAADDDDIPL